MYRERGAVSIRYSGPTRPLPPPSGRSASIFRWNTAWRVGLPIRMSRIIQGDFFRIEKDFTMSDIRETFSKFEIFYENRREILSPIENYLDLRRKNFNRFSRK